MRPDPSFVTVGIGASAGGLEALEILLAHLPAETGMAFVLVQHLDPGHPSLMPELLARRTKIPIHAAENGQRVQPNHFYVMPPNVTLTIKAGILQASAPVEHAKVRTHIDTFLRSLAEDQTVHAVGVILSGAGSDGTVGLKAIKEQGGVTLVQSPTSAKYDSMPLSAISTGLVDFSLPVEEIPAKLVEHAQYLEKVKRTRSIKGLQEEAIDFLPRICEIVHHVTGHDFSGYKPNTMARRIERRLQVHHLDSVVSYVAKLENDPAEAEALLKDFLIGVTQFFRDPDAFEALARKVIPDLLENKGAGSRVRVWVPGCASGEEAYSIAILLSAQMAKLNVAPHVQIFATDIDGDAINVARIAKYPASLVEQLSPERRERFFTAQGDFYQVIKPIRDMCIFSIHNLVRDPPFSLLDLISCRNLLIYMDAGLQKKLIPLLHYALAPSGYLFLGSSEGLAEHTGLFRELEAKYRIFQRVDSAVRPPVFFPTSERALAGGRLAQPASRPKTLKSNDIGSIVARMALEEAPPCVVINDRGGIIYSSGNTGLYLQQPAGAATLDVIEQAIPALRLSLRTGIREALKSHAASVHRNLTVTTAAGPRVIDLVVRPMPELGKASGLFAVVFQASGRNQEHAVEMSVPTADSAVHQLESELKITRGELQTAVEDLETSNEELKSSNEELLSMNEELQSANEELQTSKEEMQSVNEELATVNSELNRKVEQVNAANADLQNLFRSTDIATLFLDRDLLIKRFTPAATAIFNLIDSDVGRPINNFASRLADTDLAADIQRVLQTLKAIERPAYSPGSQNWFMVRILPSRTHEKSIDGIVVTFANITALKKSDESLRESERRLQTLADAIPQLAWVARADGWVDWYNRRWYEYTGTTPQQMEGWGWQSVHAAETLPQVVQKWKECLATGESFEMIFPLRGADGQFRPFLTRIVPLKDAQGRVVQWFGSNTDVTELKRTEEAQSLLAAIVESSDDAILSTNLDGTILSWNAGAQRLLGYQAEEIVGKSITVLLSSDGAQEERQIVAKVRQGEQVHHLESVRIAKNGRGIDVSVTVSPLKDKEGNVIGVSKVLRDITERRLAEDALRESEQRLKVALLNAPITVYTNDLDLRYTWIHKPNLGLSAEWMLGKRDDELLPLETVSPLIEMKRHVLATGHSERRHLTVTIDGKSLTFDTTIEPQRDATGTISGLIGAVMDVSDLAHAKEIAEAANSAKDHFLAALSHELRTPLTPVLTTAEVLEFDEALSPGYRDKIRMIRRNVELEVRLIDDLLDVTRITRNKIELHITTVDVHESIARVVEMCQEDAAAKKLVIETDLIAKPHLVQADPARFQQIIWNLLKNAIKFTSNAGRITISTISKPNRRIVIQVQDTGVGIDAEVIPYIFDAFEQGGRDVTQKFGGLGLGLAITKALVERHGGAITVGSAGKDKGATFNVDLPISDCSEVVASKPRAKIRKDLRCTILLVEDHADTRQVMEHLLTALGCVVKVAGSVKEAIEVAETQEFNIVISDIGLPDGAGTELIRKLKARYRVKGIALSGYGSDDDLIRSKEAGFDAHLVKPINLGILEETVSRLAGG